ncbi:NmrA family protein [Astrocystis sublimbata]|nr:NmrA family protein [Astrocystis sublimbata]
MATYLVTQATGNQSRWTVTHLLAAGAKVHALVRDPSKVPDILKSPSVTLFKGESLNFDDVFNAAQGCVGVFLNTFPGQLGSDSSEAQQAKTVLEACKKAGLKGVVASTAMVTELKAMWSDAATEELHLDSYWTSKTAVEDAVRGAGFESWTILRPGYCHFNYYLPACNYNMPMLPTHGKIDHHLDDGSRMLQTDANDVGKYAAAALQDPAKFTGHGISVASENLTIEEVRDILVRVAGKEVGLQRCATDEAPVGGQIFQKWVNSKDLNPVLEEAKKASAKFGIPLTSLEEALQRERGHLLETLPAYA